MEMHQPYSSSPTSQTNSPPTSNSNSPSHEFSFTISFNSSSNSNNTTLFNNEKTKLPPQKNSLALDLSPADEIFFHGHLLPLHLLSHLPQSPRSSTNSMESFTLPIRELIEDENPKQSTGTDTDTGTTNNNRGSTKGEGKSKPNSFSLFGLKKGLKGCKVRNKEEEYKEGSNNNNNKHKKRLKFDVIHALKKYLRMVQPLVMFRGKREKFRGPNGSKSYSYSGNVTPRKNKNEFRGWRGQQLLHSAPASMRTSPTNSGLLIAASDLLPPPSDSTMEELQAAIQAAIAHCKNSIAKEEKLKR